MSSASTSLPDLAETFSYLMRAPVPFSSWLKCTSWSRTAVYAFTGTFTSPKLIEPVHTDRTMPVLSSALAIALVALAGLGVVLGVPTLVGCRAAPHIHLVLRAQIGKASVRARVCPYV